MQIVITLNSYEELEELQAKLAKMVLGKPAAEEKPKKAAPKKAEPAPEPVADPEPEPTPTAEDKPKAEADESAVKVMLADKIKAGKKAEVRALFDEYGVAKLSELTAKYPDKLAEFAEKAEAL